MTLAGRRCGAYAVWGQMSAGGMGDVWLAKHEALAIPVVLKTLQRTDAGEVARREERLVAEARAMARVSSPRVVRVLDVGAATGSDPAEEHVPYLVEEYVDGLDLAELDQRRRAAFRRGLPLAALCEKLVDACEGLHAAHQAGVVHRDVKPGNLFSHGQGHVKVGDFGIAVDAGDDVAHVPAGTLHFMAPEQLAGERVDRRADVWSLGATAFALRYGRPPFDSPFGAMRGEPPLFPPARSPEEAFFQHVVARMLAPRPEARYASLLAVRRDLHAVDVATRRPLQAARIGEHAWLVGGARVSFEVGDLARVPCDAIVNSAYSELGMRSGVGEALRRAGGDAIEEEVLAAGPRPLGDVVVTGAGALPARAVLHAVGAWNEVSCVSRATHRALLVAEERGYARLALPAIGTGRGRVPLEACADAMVGTLRSHLALGGSRLRELRFVLYDAPTLKRFEAVAHAVLEGLEDGFDEGMESASTGGDYESVSAPTAFAFSAPPPPGHGAEARSPASQPAVAPEAGAGTESGPRATAAPGPASGPAVGAAAGAAVGSAAVPDPRLVGRGADDPDREAQVAPVPPTARAVPRS
jgi:serine/threonine-protein kinase